ncbi:MAG TPA: tRNA glutamyl-Q(34) synthetase GluQRS [Polyangiaceae bacterium]|nr:tRNA glutamyl-Q(34) synthetase GluQRS [Polyangiaceae bacterium]
MREHAEPESSQMGACSKQAAFGSSVGRLLPSPTGRLHLGHARTFLIAYWHARSRGGRLVLRIEDLDAPRVVPGAADDVVRDLAWLGIDWDGPVVLQSAHLSASNAACEELLRRGLAYACVCSRGDLRTAQSAPQAGVAEPRYPGTCRGRFASVAEAERVTGKPAGVRFAVPPGRVDLVDAFAGPFSVDVAAEIGDFLIARKGGLPAYQLAVVVDDAAQGVTEVVRGDDLLPSTARQYLLRRALGLPEPAYWHVPLVVDGAGRRLAKRADDSSLAELRDRGVDPRAVASWVARTAGIDDAAHESAAELSSRFSMQRVPRTQVSSQGVVESLTAR